MNKTCFQSAGCFYSSFCCYNVEERCQESLRDNCVRSHSGILSCVNNHTGCQHEFTVVCCKVITCWPGSKSGFVILTAKSVYCS